MKGGDTPHQLRPATPKPPQLMKGVDANRRKGVLSLGLDNCAYTRYIRCMQTNGTTTTARTETARTIATEDFNNGRPLNPSNPRMMEVLSGLKVGEGAAEIMTAYNNAWIEANLAAPVPA